MMTSNKCGSIYSAVVLPCQCGMQLCVECRTQKHPGLTCREKIAVTTGSNEIVLEVARDKGWKQCPKCHMMIELVSGCNHMSCTSCRYQFCFRCLRKWSTQGDVCSWDAASCGTKRGSLKRERHLCRIKPVVVANVGEEPN